MASVWRKKLHVGTIGLWEGLCQLTGRYNTRPFHVLRAEWDPYNSIHEPCAAMCIQMHADLFDSWLLWDFFVRLALWNFHFSSDRFCSMSNETFCCRSSWITGSFQWDLRWDKSCTIRVDQMSLRNIQFCLLRKFHSQYSHPNLKTILNYWISKTSLKH